MGGVEVRFLGMKSSNIGDAAELRFGTLTQKSNCARLLQSVLKDRFDERRFVVTGYQVSVEIRDAMKQIFLLRAYSKEA